MSYYKNIQQYKENATAAEEVVCRVYNIEAEVIYNRVRTSDSVHARFAVWYLLLNKYKMSTAVIGKMYGYDHTTVMNGVNRAVELGIPKEICE